jgi:translation initiation factor 2B subunit (eIF-2B alpha/beta/delta family)/8-oxo-dGTP pyrophosphatase MutT (NUDIX family)
MLRPSALDWWIPRRATRATSAAQTAIRSGAAAAAIRSGAIVAAAIRRGGAVVEARPPPRAMASARDVTSAVAAEPPPHSLPLAPFRRGRRQVVTAFVLDQERRILVVRRSDRVRDYKGKWGGVSGGVEAGDASLAARASQEIAEEAGLPGLRAVRYGRPLAVDDDNGEEEGGGGRRRRRFLVHPFLFHSEQGGGDDGEEGERSKGGSSSSQDEGDGEGEGGGTSGLRGQGDPSPTTTATPTQPSSAAAPSPPPPPPPVQLNWENTAFAFVAPDELRALPHVPLLPETLERLFAPTPEAQRALDALAADRRSGAAQLASQALSALRQVWPQLYAGGDLDDALERWRSYAFLLATARPSMAAVANAVAGAVDGVMEAAAAAAAAEADEEEQAGARSPLAVHGALDVAEQRLRDAQDRAALAAARAIDRLWQRRWQQQQEQPQQQLGRSPAQLPPPLIVLTLSYSSTVEQSMACLAKMVPASGSPRPRLVARVLESRPLLEGVRLARRLRQGGWDTVEVYTDAQAAVAARGATAMLVGADAVVVVSSSAAAGGPTPPRGRVVNKVGTLPAALACRELGVPVVAVVDSLKIAPGPVLRDGVFGVSVGVGVGGSGEEEEGEEEEEEEEEEAAAQEAREQKQLQLEEMGPEELTPAWQLHQRAVQEDALLTPRNVYFEGSPLELFTGGIVTGWGGGSGDGTLTAEDVAREAAFRRKQYDRVFGLLG